jgi:hypothetical protein
MTLIYQTEAVRSPEPVRAQRWAVGRLVALAVAVFLLPWSVLLWLTLPDTTTAHNWALAWVGLDGAVVITALGTAFLLSRHDPRAALPATAMGMLLLVDCWFDVCTSAPGLEHLLAVTEGAVAEVPLACAAIWLSVVLTGSRPQADD